MSYIGRGTDKISNIEVLDNITFDGSSSYSITKSSVAFTPNSAQSLLISIDGVVQATNFTVSSSTIDFGVAIPSTSTCDFFLHYGTGLITIPADGTVTSAKLSYPLTTFSSTGIDDNATSTAITIDSSEQVGIGETSPLGKLHVKTGDSGSSAAHSIADELVIESSGSGGLNILTGSGGNAHLSFGDSADNNIGIIQYNHSDNSLRTTVNAAERMRIDSSGRVGIGTTSPTYELDIQGSASSTDLRVLNTGTGISRLRLISGGTSSSSLIEFGDDSDVNVGSILYSHGDNYMNFVTNADSHMRLNSTGDLTIGDTLTEVQPGLGNNTQAISLRGGNTEQFFISSAASPMFVNRTADGGLIQFYSAGNNEGSISISGSTVSYNGFTGTHWSRFIDNSKPTILKGTVLETLDEMCDWYNLEFDVTDEEGNTSTQRVPHILQDGQSVGDTVAHSYEGTDVQATIVKETDIKHVKSKVSDTVDAKNVYGVFMTYDEDGEGYNDFYVASVGSFVVRIKANETIAKGDLLQSNGDGTAKVQSDDAVRSSSFAKVLSTTVIETYDDGSFIVPCSLMC